jgi:hypothetical protein
MVDLSVRRVHVWQRRGWLYLGSHHFGIGGRVASLGHSLKDLHSKSNFLLRDSRLLKVYFTSARRIIRSMAGYTQCNNGGTF